MTKYRGFRKDGKGWVDGSHLKVDGNHFIVPTLTKMVSIYGSDLPLPKQQ